MKVYENNFYGEGGGTCELITHGKLNLECNFLSFKINTVSKTDSSLRPVLIFPQIIEVFIYV